MCLARGRALRLLPSPEGRRHARLWVSSCEKATTRRVGKIANPVLGSPETRATAAETPFTATASLDYALTTRRGSAPPIVVFSMSTCAARFAVGVHLARPSRVCRRRVYTPRASDDPREGGDVLEISSTKELHDLVSASKAGGKVAVLEVRRVKGGPKVEAFAPRYASMAADFAGSAVLAKLLMDKSEATRLAAKSLNVEEVPEFFIWKDGEMQSEFAGVSYDGLHHAISRSLGVVEDVG